MRATCLHLAVTWTGRLLCWTLATAMASAALQAVVHPTVAWWGAVWLMPWGLVPALALCWAVFRALEKSSPDGPRDDPDSTSFDQSPDAYDTAA
ncbi:hypothetical protein [Streptomyces tsukubensis]|uniref:Uncharacterized protein n=1 Tax=Streptomyces tsukubensis TaxID=83656 RepID=A0A1V4A948_9ACTN|nr:hypothetical protein [Streptomyces tsukubensis]OON78760.1 hypothetical protein B1H18_15365 [Streptomyces tsukubensis]